MLKLPIPMQFNSTQSAALKFLQLMIFGVTQQRHVLKVSDLRSIHSPTPQSIDLRS